MRIYQSGPHTPWQGSVIRHIAKTRADYATRKLIVIGIGIDMRVTFIGSTWKGTLEVLM
jgi:hypothetical protein